MIDLSKVKGLADDVKGAITQIADAAGNVLWSAASWPEDLNTGLEFASANAFTLSAPTSGWDGTMEYCNSPAGWQSWDGSEISSGETKSGQRLYIRGTGNTKVTGTGIIPGVTTGATWFLTGTDIACNGNIENLLDYATVASGTHPTMAAFCYAALFSECTSLTTAPALPATTLVQGCYQSMFSYCTNLTTAPTLPATTLANNCYQWMLCGTGLTTAPALPATTLANNCYQGMFLGCTKIKLASSASGTYTIAYRIPYTGTGTTATNALKDMFVNTGGTFTGTPSINTTYYLDSSNTIV